MLNCWSSLLFFCIGLATALRQKDGEADDKTFSASLQMLEIAPKVLTTVPYGNSRLSVWGHLDNPNRRPNRKKYFVMPMVMLSPSSITCRLNVLTGKTTLQFKCVMWNKDVTSAVLNHLKVMTTNRELKSIQIETLPMDQVRLMWANSAEQLSNDFILNKDWKSYAHQDNNLRFKIVVTTMELCTRAKEQLQKQPDSLGNMELQYLLHGTRTFRKRVQVEGKHIRQGNMYTKMLNKADPNGNVYLNSYDLNKFAQDAMSTIEASVTTDADYVDTGDSISVSKLIYNNLASYKQSTDTMTPQMWESTFWQDDFVRPDKLISFLNKVFTKDQGQNHTILIDDEEIVKTGE